MVWLTVALFASLSLLATVQHPTYRAPDEPRHVDLVRLMSQHPLSYPNFDERHVSEAVQRSTPVVGVTVKDFTSFRRLRNHAPPATKRPSFSDLGSEKQTTELNQLAQHPPLYYVAAGLTLRAVTELVPGAKDWPFDRTVLFLRVLSVLLVLPIPLLAFLTARRLGADDFTGTAAALLSFIAPYFTTVISCVTNDSLLVLEGGLLTYLLARVWTGDLSRRTAVVVGVVLGAALLTKGLALYMPVFVAAAYALAAARSRVRRAALAPASIAVGVGLVLGGWWWVRNLLVNGAVQPTAVVYPQPGARQFSDWYWLGRMMRVMSEQFFVPFYGTGLHASLARALIVLCWATIGVCLLAWIVRRRRTDRFAVAEAGLLAMPVIAPLTMVLWSTYQWWLDFFRFVGVGARYMLPGTVGATVLIAGGAHMLSRGNARLVAVVSLTLVGGAHLWGTLADLRKFFGPSQAGYKQWFLAMLDWAPIPSRVTVGLVVLVAMLWAATLSAICLHRTGARETAATAGRPASERLSAA
ncbi:MAG: phospholipid carrier-dependent glycosyltransferase [Sporichthyaceae bacterium]